MLSQPAPGAQGLSRHSLTSVAQNSPVQFCGQIHCASPLASSLHVPKLQFMATQLSVTEIFVIIIIFVEFIFTNVAEWATVSIITIASISSTCAVIENAFSGNANVFVAGSQILSKVKKNLCGKRNLLLPMSSLVLSSHLGIRNRVRGNYQGRDHHSCKDWMGSSHRALKI